MPPLGKVAERTIWIDSACKVHVDPVRVMDASAFSTPLDGRSERSWAVSGARDSGPIPLTSYNGAAYAVERTWDCCGILLNELYSNLTFSGNGSVITSLSGMGRGCLPP